MIDFINDIQKAIEAKAYCIALMGALTVPDMCSAMECGDGLSNSGRYENWFNHRLAGYYAGAFSGKQCYLYWSRLFHPATGRGRLPGTERHAFVLPRSTGTSTDFRANGIVYLDLTLFCLHMGNAANDWLKAVKWTEPFETNSARLFTMHPNGVLGAAVKCPMIC